MSIHGPHRTNPKHFDELSSGVFVLVYGRSLVIRHTQLQALRTEGLYDGQILKASERDE